MKTPSVTWRRRAVTGGVIAFVFAGVMAFGLLARPAEERRTTGPGVEPLPVAWRAVAWEPGYAVTRSFVGRVEARQASDAGFEIPGMVATVDVEEGDAVATGQRTATLDAKRLKAQRDELRAARDQAKARLELEDITLRRTRQAFERTAATQRELDLSEQAYLAAKAELQRAEAAVASLDVDIAKTEIRSPFDAVVAQRYVDTGRVVAAGTPIVRLLERKNPEVRIGVGGAAIDRIETGQVYGVQVRDRVVPGAVTAILPTRDRVGRAVDVLLTLDAELDGIRDGDLARVQLERRVEERGFWAPTQALTEGVRGLWSVYLLDEAASAADEAILRRVDVEVLHVDTDRVFIRGALDSGDRVVMGGHHRLAPGMLVRFADSPEPSSAAQGEQR